MATRAAVTPATGRYTRVAVVLHWLMAAAILFMLGLGFLMGSDLVDKPTSFKLYQLHKSVGIVLLWLIAVRLAWRLTHRAPELQGPYPKWERALAALGHLALYLLMLAMPLTGWLLVSSSPLGFPTMLFGLVEWPHIGFVVGNEQVNAVSDTAHVWLAWVLVVMVAIHVLAVIKHWVIDRQNILVRMRLPPRRNATTTTLLLVFGLALPSAPAPARPYVIDYSKSKIEFAVAQAGTVVRGTFAKWQAAIDFDGTQPEAARISATIDTTSATTNDKTRDASLLSADWLNAATFPQATFVSQKVTGSGFGSYTAEGLLTLRGQAKPATLAFKLPFEMATGKANDGTPQTTPMEAAIEKKETPDERAQRAHRLDKQLDAAKKAGVDPTVITATGTISVKRLDYGIGAQSDRSGQWVGLEIPLALTIVARPQ